MSNLPTFERSQALIKIETDMSDLCARGQIVDQYRYSLEYKAKMKDLRDSYLKLKRSPDMEGIK